MKKTFFTTIFIFAFSLVSFTVQAQSAPAAAQDSCQKLEKWFSLNGTSIVQQLGLPKFCNANEAALFVIGLLLRLSGTVAVIFIMYGGYLYLTSAGSDETMEKAKNVLVNSVLGLAVVIMAGALVRVVAGLLQK